MNRRLLGRFFVAFCLLAAALPCSGEAPLSAADAEAFLVEAEAQLLDLWIGAERAAWVQYTYIIDDTEILTAQAEERKIAATIALAQESTKFDEVQLPPELRRRLDALKLSLTLPAPAEPELTSELTRIASRMNGLYGKGSYCRDSGECLALGDLSRILSSSDDPGEMLEAWTGWRTISPPMRSDFVRYVELANQGAQGLGYPDLGAMWRSKYDMEPAAFAAELRRLWDQLSPLYDALHCHVRARLAELYGMEVVPEGEPIPAHLLGNMWAQSWINIYDKVGPKQEAGSYDLTALLVDQALDARGMVRYGEGFFTSLGFEPLPETFWQRSLFTKPADRDVVCHASAWDVDWEEDLRLKMCIEINDEDFYTVHHELGHNFYQRAYKDQPALFRESANDGFHEAVGDAVALSITPDYLIRLGLLGEAPPAEADLGILLKMALDKISFLPFGFLVDQWRWQVFDGQIPPERYNEAWWDMREELQGVRAPVARSEANFDPGAKYHIASNVPYTRYFLAGILQFQLHRGLCEKAGWEGPLHRCSIYGNAEAGAALREMLAMGSSRPWPEALEVITGSREMDATAILDYFAPVQEWLDRENEGRSCGW